MDRGENEGQERGVSADMSAENLGWVSTDMAARGLGVSPRTVRRMIERGTLQGKLEEAGITKSWLVSKYSLQRLQAQRQPSRRDVRRGNPEEPAPGMADALCEITERLEARAAAEAELRTRLDLTEKAASNLLDERNRLSEELDSERQRLRLAQEEARRLREKVNPQSANELRVRLFVGLMFLVSMAVGIAAVVVFSTSASL
ncbi:MAG TPA: helix-turn-helix domain-containing protein [Rubrobacteraceae bacterium]|nr:helix-turn-helix domain-containing protein [Rubrobacteraceae bacterium]